MAKKPLLQVGQIVWLETTNRFGCDVRNEAELDKMVVLEANKTSAYIWHNDQDKVRYKVNQKTHEVRYSIPDGRTYQLWLSKEKYEQNVAHELEMKQLLEQAQKKIMNMSLEDLRSFVTD